VLRNPSRSSARGIASPSGASDCSHGWSASAAGGQAQPVVIDPVFFPPRPDRGEGKRVRNCERQTANSESPVAKPTADLSLSLGKTRAPVRARPRSSALPGRRKRRRSGHRPDTSSRQRESRVVQFSGVGRDQVCHDPHTEMANPATRQPAGGALGIREEDDHRLHCPHFRP
jgi:hypothetical protein